MKRPVTALDDKSFCEMFSAAFRSAMRKAGIQISETETTSNRLTVQKVRATVRIYVYAGDITSAKFYDPTTKTVVKGGELIQIGEVGFRFTSLCNISGSEFAVVYDQV